MTHGPRRGSLEGGALEGKPQKTGWETKARGEPLRPRCGQASVVLSNRISRGTRVCL